MPHDIPVLVKSKMLKPLGNPPQQAVKYFAAAEIEKLSCYFYLAACFGAAGCG
jgi:hypothetical protein